MRWRITRIIWWAEGPRGLSGNCWIRLATPLSNSLRERPEELGDSERWYGQVLLGSVYGSCGDTLERGAAVPAGTGDIIRQQIEASVVLMHAN